MTLDPPLPRRISRAEIEHALHLDRLRRHAAAGDIGAAIALGRHLPLHEAYAVLAATRSPAAPSPSAL
ncbi:hypothetical protein OIE91_11425 [Streptomyces albidoflavus]|uniref:hypothetical protein n=1 Tax=Streptomyces TaxID=1883 RepID=UPI0002830E66|nr:hypothetical protein [Streptomyces sp. SM8]PKA32899.1 hypothetical protein SM8_032045 [Streptomyces sp. SM8]